MISKDDLTKLDLSDEQTEQLLSILKEKTSDRIQIPKWRFDEEIDKNKKLSAELETLTAELDKLRNSSINPTNKNEVQAEDSEMKNNDFETRLAEMEQRLTNTFTEKLKNEKIENAILLSGAKHQQAVKSFLDYGKIQFEDGKLMGLDEQIKSLKENEDTSYLFNANGVPTAVKGLKGAKPGDASPNRIEHEPELTFEQLVEQKLVGRTE